MELLFNIDEKSEKVIYVQLYEYMKNKIIKGLIDENEKLPSIRTFSKDLGVSSTTIESAYNQLLIEGYIVSKPRSGYFVNKLGEIHSIVNVDHSVNQQEETREQYRYDFKSEYIEKDNFDFSIMKKHINYVLNYETDKLFRYGELQGDLELRKEIIKYVNRTRGIGSTVDRVVIGAGIYPLLTLITSLFKELQYKQIAFENPGFNRAKNIFLNNGFDVQGVDILQNGIDIEALEKSDAKISYVSPSHQFPTGNVMTIDNRIRLIKWAVAHNGYIIEDDFNSELRYEGQPISALKGIDGKDRVIYLGSFSTVLAPSVRISFIILPKELMTIYQNKKHHYSQTASMIEQSALANMMRCGDFERHVRKIRKKYSRKREYILDRLGHNLDETINVHGSDSGLHILLRINEKFDVKEIVTRCKEKGVNLSEIREYEIDKKIDENILVLNYRGIDTKDIEPGIRIIREVIRQVEK